MFDEMTKKYIQAAISSEKQNAIENYGLTYNSDHEAFAVLKEEVEETRDEQIQVKNGLYKFWNEIKNNKNIDEKNIAFICEHAEKLALEAVQVAAVCKKILNGI